MSIKGLTRTDGAKALDLATIPGSPVFSVETPPIGEKEVIKESANS